MKKFCVIPWYSREINLISGQESVCCWIKQPVSRSDLQNKFLAGQEIPECDACWQAELRGIESRRQMENRFLDFKMDRDIAMIQQDVMNDSVDPNMYQIFLGSTCNGTCVTCGPDASSSWRRLIKKTVSIKQENQQAGQNFEDYSRSINWAAAKRFNLLGGEPLLIPRSADILRKLLAVGNTDCRVSFVTNGSVTVSDDQIDLIRNFSDIACCVSIDGIDRSFEYLRYPLSWQTLLSNLDQYRAIFSEVVISFTVSNLNYHDRPEILQWFRDQNLLFIENYVVSPPWFDRRVDPSHELWPRFVQEIEYQDRIKGISIGDYLPHIAALIGQTCR